MIIQLTSAEAELGNDEKVKYKKEETETKEEMEDIGGKEEEIEKKGTNGEIETLILLSVSENNEGF